MEFTKNILAALLVTTICILESTYAAAPNCTDDNPVCASCTHKGICKNGTAPTLGDKCPEGEACVMADDTPLCKPIAKTECDCGGKTRGCDAFNPNQQISCFGGMVFLDENECTGENETCTGEGVCAITDGTPTPPVGGDLTKVCSTNPPTGPEFRVVTPSCRSGVFCNKDKMVGSAVKCSDSEFFDVQRGSCAPYPPANPCTCGKEKCPVVTDCSMYGVCEGNSLVDIETCTDSTKKFFDPSTGNCGGSEGKICKQYTNCKFTQDTTTSPSSDTPTSIDTTLSPGANPATPSTTTSRSNTPTTTTKPSACNASNVNKRYPHESDCKKYYTCRLVSRNTYEYVPSKCVGNLVFNPANGFCDLLENVPTCPK